MNDQSKPQSMIMVGTQVIHNSNLYLLVQSFHSLVFRENHFGRMIKDFK